MTERKNLLFISNLYPNACEPNMASFNRQQVQALSNYFDIDVIAPVSWQVKLKNRPFPFHGKLESVNSCHPTYFYTPGSLRSLYGYFFSKSIQSCVNRLIGEKSYHAIYGSWLYPDGWACAKLAKRLGVPLFLKVHGTDVNQLEPGATVTERSLWAVEQAQAVFCVSQALKERLIELGASAEKLHVVYNGVNTSIFYPVPQADVRKQLGVGLDEKLILYVGNLKETKGLGELGAAFQQVRSRAELAGSRLIVVGQGAYAAKFQSELERLGVLPKVSFLGSLPLDQVAAWMNATDLLCLPSYMEGVPNVILEAMSCETPVVATSVGGIPELAIDGSDLTLVNPFSVSSLIEGLVDRAKGGGRMKAPQFIGSWQENANSIVQIMDSENHV